jgi:hypothetical protein
MDRVLREQARQRRQLTTTATPVQQQRQQMPGEDLIGAISCTFSQRSWEEANYRGIWMDGNTRTQIDK